MAEFLNFIFVIGVVVLLFGAAIFVHEFGHFWVALKRGLKVEEFAIGFGPILWSREKDGILYSIRWIPAGGFVKLPQMLTSEALEGKPKEEDDEGEPEDDSDSSDENQTPKEEPEEELPPVSPWSKILVAFAGPFMNVVFAIVIAFVLWGIGVLKPGTDPIVGYVETKDGEYSKVEPGDKFLKVSGQPVDSWQDVILGVLDHQGDMVPVMLERGGKSFDVTLQADTSGGRFKMLHITSREQLTVGALDKKGYLTGIGLEPGDQILKVNDREIHSQYHLVDQLLSSPGEKTILVSRDGNEKAIAFTTPEHVGVKVLEVPMPKLGSWDSFWTSIGLMAEQEIPPTPAIEAGVKKGDLILNINGESLTNTRQLIRRIQASGDREVRLKVLRDNEVMPLTVTPRINPGTQRVQIGIALGDDAGIIFQPPSPSYREVKPGPTPWAQIEDVWSKTITTIGALFRSSETGVGAKDLSGPVGILGMLSIFVNTDYRLALSFLVLLNINLAILNLLPVPVLDGGHIVMSIIEKIRNKPISIRVQEYATTVFALMLLSFMLYVTFFDIKERIPLFKELFSRDAKIQQEPLPE